LPTSKKTNELVISTLKAWAWENKIKWDEVQRLFHMLASVHGNSSFQKTIEALNKRVMEEK